LARIHPAAVVEPGAKLAEDVEIGAQAYVGAEVELASGVVLRPHAHVTSAPRGGHRVFLRSARRGAQDPSFRGEHRARDRQAHDIASTP
jgi:UDP-N-acetylglucosamine acyltransferase